AKTLVPLPPEMEEESGRMLSWLYVQQSGPSAMNQVIIGVQHIPAFRDGAFPDTKPYWSISELYRSREIKALQQLGVKHMLVGHWHNGRVFEAGGLTWHVAPATSW